MSELGVQEQQPATKQGRAWARRVRIGITTGLTDEALAYAKSIGIPEGQITHLGMRGDQAKVWHYLRRCSQCGAFVGREGVCNNPRCDKGKVRAQVKPPMEWHWPPDAISLQFLQESLGIDGDLPDSHAAWHARGQELAQRAAHINRSLAQGSANDPMEAHQYLQDVRRHVNTGMRYGWMDPQSRAYDRDMAQRLQNEVDWVLHSSNMWSFAALTGDWMALVNRGDKLAYLLNPAYPPSIQSETRAEARRVFEEAMGNDVKRSRLADRTIQAINDGISALRRSPEARNVVPALLPPLGEIDSRFQDDLRKKLHQEHPWLVRPSLNEDHPFYPNGSAAEELYLWMTRIRVDTFQGLSDTQKARAVRVLQVAGKDLGYPEGLTESEAAAILDNGWAPSQARQVFRRFKRAQGRIMQSLQSADDPQAYYEAGRVFDEEQHRLAQRWTFGLRPPGERDHKERRIWPDSIGLDVPSMSDEELRAFALGTGNGALQFASPRALRRWLQYACEGMSQSAAHYYPQLTLNDPATRREITNGIKDAIVDRGLCSATDSVNLSGSAFFDAITVREGQNRRRYRIDIGLDADGTPTVSFVEE